MHFPGTFAKSRCALRFTITNPFGRKVNRSKILTRDFLIMSCLNPTQTCSWDSSDVQHHLRFNASRVQIRLIQKVMRLIQVMMTKWNEEKQMRGFVLLSLSEAEWCPVKTTTSQKVWTWINLVMNLWIRTAQLSKLFFAAPAEFFRKRNVSSASENAKLVARRRKQLRAFWTIFWSLNSLQKGVLVHKNTFASCQRCRHSVEPHQ